MKSWIKKKATATEAPLQSVPLAPQGQPQGMPQHGGPQIMPQVVAGSAYPGQPQNPYQQAPGQQQMRPPQPMQAPQPMNAPQPMQAPQAMPAPQPQAYPSPQNASPVPHPGQGMQPMPEMQNPGLPPVQQPAVHAQPQMQMQPHAQQAATAPLITMPEAIGSDRDGGELALPAISVHAFCDRPETAGTVQATSRDWRMNRTNLKVYMGGLPAAVDFYHKENTPNLILIESGMRGAELFAQLDQLASVCDAGTKVVVIGATNDIRLYRELMDKGVSDYLVPPFHPLTLIRSLSDLYADPDKPFVGRVAAFFGAKGGVGSSTISHNIAWALSTVHAQETALVDLDASWGTTGLDFNYDSVQGLEEALAAPDRLDETLLDRIMLRHTEKLSLLPAAASLNNSGMENAAAFEAIVEGIRKISPMSILDLPHYWTDWTSKVLVGADDVVITATPDLANLRNTKNLMEFLKAERPNDAPPILILNKTGVPKTPEIPVKEFAAALGIEPSLVLPYEPVLYAQAANDGKMLSEMKSDNKAVEGFNVIGHRLRLGAGANLPMKTGSKAKSSGSIFSKLKKKK